MIESILFILFIWFVLSLIIIYNTIDFWDNLNIAGYIFMTIIGLPVMLPALLIVSLSKVSKRLFLKEEYRN